jgi:hypothetical protein
VPVDPPFRESGEALPEVFSRDAPRGTGRRLY